MAPLTARWLKPRTAHLHAIVTIRCQLMGSPSSGRSSAMGAAPSPAPSGFRVDGQIGLAHLSGDPPQPVPGCLRLGWNRPTLRSSEPSPNRFRPKEQQMDRPAVSTIEVLSWRALMSWKKSTAPATPWVRRRRNRPACGAGHGRIGHSRSAAFHISVHHDRLRPAIPAGTVGMAPVLTLNIQFEYFRERLLGLARGGPFRDSP